MSVRCAYVPNGGTLQLRRDTDGRWVCLTGLDSGDRAAVPSSFSTGLIPGRGPGGSDALGGAGDQCGAPGQIDVHAAPAPLRKRAASMTSVDVARPAAALAPPKTVRPAISSGLPALPQAELPGSRFRRPNCRRPRGTCPCGAPGNRRLASYRRPASSDRRRTWCRRRERHQRATKAFRSGNRHLRPTFPTVPACGPRGARSARSHAGERVRRPPATHRCRPRASGCAGAPGPAPRARHGGGHAIRSA